ncbi:unnamed protein product [Spirodela intermedia]|uniref:non-specific serine/threonine protein kinase n=1 Tax=Spirodela intermedia TaxID=51605 RepID=A0A7I8JRU4_SPIIN|nr:unnamed protein product [Spirodela intermedia]CAA6672844.1 unnamed protein product [Spirodela intermedia]
MGLWVLMICFLALSTTAQSQSSTGFISIDCGLDGATNYTESTMNIIYSPDALYVNAGENRRVSPETNLTGLFEYYKTLRSFSNGTRNCYTLQPLVKGRKYLVRAEFQYGNFDGRDSPPTFDVYLGIHFWWTVPPDEFSRLEIIVVSPGESMQVCLVNKGLGTPYISVLELRPLLDSMYPLVNASQALVLRGDRTDHGSTGTTRYPEDPYDRIWFSPGEIEDWLPMSTDKTVESGSREFMVPASVLSTAVTTPNISESLNFTVTGLLGEEIYVFMYFAELQQLGMNETREFNVYANSTLWFRQYRPDYLSGGAIYTTTRNSTLPPFINAFEAHILVQLSTLPTHQNDTDAVLKIKNFYKVKNWEGDPCVPKDLAWAGLGCSYDGSLNPRIVSLNLSHAGLSGGISPFIANLTALVTLDLSHNNLIGEIPRDLVELSQLKVLQLENNDLSGYVPYILLEKSANKTLSLSKGRKKRVIVPIAISIGGILALLSLILIIMWRVRMRKQKDVQNISSKKIESSNNEQKNLHSVSSQFTFAEIVNITKNFQQQIGKGGFGIVYHGRLKTGIEVAVKMLSKTSSQGAKEFESEAQILTRVHHRNLVSFLGYCNDPNNLSLVYEFMTQGTLAKHLSDNRSNDLSWSIRLKIALDVAQGLDYLHSFCKPPIIHRDVKTTNILLNQSLEAKLADFGLSRLFHDDASACISTAIVGTPGYLDPEYYQTSNLNAKSDIYSFGVVLFELITGKPPIINSTENISIVPWVQSRINRGDITMIVDERFEGKYNINSMWKAIEIAVSCTAPYSIQRPTMSNVVMELKECLTSETSQDIPRNFKIQEESSVDIVPLFLDTATGPLAR